MSELVEDKVNGLANLLEIIGGEQLIDWKVTQQSIIVSGCLQLLLEACVEPETEDEGDPVGLLEQLGSDLEQVVLELLVDVGE